MNEKKLKVERQKNLPVIYRGVHLDCGYRLDFLVEDQVVVEVKAVDKLESIHEAQIISYLKLSGCKAGLLFNFKVKIFQHGIRRFVNEFSG